MQISLYVVFYNNNMSIISLAQGFPNRSKKNFLCQTQKYALLKVKVYFVIKPNFLICGNKK